MTAAGTSPDTRPHATASVIVCAYTPARWDLLTSALRAAADQFRPRDELVLVIDHNEDLLKRAQDELGDIALVIENHYERGLSGARNTGIEASAGDVVVFLDDDACPRPGWLGSLLAPFSADTVMACGGTARPVWAHGRPGWFPDEFDWVVGCSYRGQTGTGTDAGDSRIVEARNPLGCNMAFRRTVFDEVGAFRVGIGRVGRLPLGCEETELCIRLRQAVPAARIVLVPGAVVDHHVTPERHRFTYFAQRCFAEGVSKAAVAGQVGTADGLSSERTYATRTLPRGIARGLRSSFAPYEQPEGAARRDGLCRSVAIVAGLALSAAGYVGARIAGVRRAGNGSATGRRGG